MPLTFAFVHFSSSIVMSSCCARVGPEKTSHLAEDALAQLVERQVRVLAAQRGQPRVAEAVALRVHRLGEAVV